MAKKIIEVPVDVDEHALLLRGWRAKEARARITSDLWHDLSLSITLEHSDAEWSDHFKNEESLSPVLLEIVSPKLGEKTYVWLPVFSKDQLRKGTVRCSESGTIAYDTAKLDAADLRLKLTSFDGADAQARIYPPQNVGRRLAVELADETSSGAVMTHVVDTDAFITKGGDPDEIVILVHGNTTLSGYQDLVQFTAQADEYYHEAGQYQVDLPDLEVDLLDETDFLLERRQAYNGLTAKGEAEADAPRRPAQWLAIFGVQTSELAGDVSKVVVRLVDSGS